MSDSTEDKVKATDAVETDLPATEEGKGNTTLTQQGTIQGVVLPCMANILGVLLFLRLPWIVGLAGVWQSFGAVLLGCTCELNDGYRPPYVGAAARA
ncbi:hypothetical protein FOZ62_016951 [Perkinsus olseni]|uniref:Uncharacterized protein n=1 Tax=Perkinsus olseni TaxID=32597 RepID=A0A7J6S6B5_PEROL|nr:hypothetical protein FOZ62_016951 [Perkinsus olseni]